MKRKEEIEWHLGALEKLVAEDSERLADWHKTSIHLWRVEFNRQGDLNDRQFEALGRVRHKVDPPPLGRANLPVSGFAPPTWTTAGLTAPGPVEQATPHPNPELRHVLYVGNKFEESAKYIAGGQGVINYAKQTVATKYGVCYHFMRADTSLAEVKSLLQGRRFQDACNLGLLLHPEVADYARALI